MNDKRPVKQPIGIVHHYPPMSSFDYALLFGFPPTWLATIWAIGKISTGLGLSQIYLVWIITLTGFAWIGWILEVAKRLLNLIEKVGYRLALADLRLLAIGQAELRHEDELLGRLGAAYDTLKAGDFSQQ